MRVVIIEKLNELLEVLSDALAEGKTHAGTFAASPQHGFARGGIPGKGSRQGPASKRQIDYLRYLAEQSGRDPEEMSKQHFKVSLDELTNAQAHELIQKLTEDARQESDEHDRQ